MKLKYLTHKYYFLFLLILMILSGYLFSAFYGEAKKNAIKTLNTNHMFHAKKAAKEIETFFEQWIERLTFISKDKSIISLDKFGKKKMQFFLDTHRDEISGITRTDASGKILFTIPNIKDVTGKDISYQQHIKEVMLTHKPVISDVFKAERGFDTVAVHVPVFRGKDYDGTIGVLINFQIIAKRSLEQIRIGETGYAWMISRDGTELYCPVPGHTGKSVFENCKDFPSIIAMVRNMLEGKEGVTTYKFDKIKDISVKTIKKHAFYMPIRLANTYWSIVVASSENEIMEYLENFRNKLIAIMCFLLFGSILLSYQGIKAWGIIQEEKRRANAENKLRESERRLGYIIDFLPEAILAIDKDGKVIVWNKAIEEMTGYSAESMLGKGDYEYAIPFYGKRRPILIDFVKTWDDEIEKQYTFINKEGNTLYTETSVPCVRGQNRILWGKASPLYDSQGNVAGAIESIHDLTERKLAEDELFREKEKLLTIFENAPFSMVLIDKEGRFVYINPMHINMFGYTSSEIPDGRTWFKKAFPDEAYRKEAISAWINDIKTHAVGEGRRRIFNVTCRDGSLKLINFIPVMLSNGDNIMVCEDITERKKMEEQLANAQKMEAIGTLAGGIAHDFNNILMGIQGHTSLMLLDASTNHTHFERLKRIEDLINSASKLTKQLLGFARGGKYDVKPVNINELIKKTSSIFERTKKEISINCVYEDDIWTVEADQNQIEQVLLNLYLNAWQAMPDGGNITLETKNEHIEEYNQNVHFLKPGRYVKISVIDTGIGMDEKTKERIFEPFFTTKEIGKGTGLGLAMVYGIIKNHNGFINVISSKGHGTIFEIYLPSSEKHILKVEDTKQDIKQGSETLLIVDDEKSVLDVTKEILESLGYTVYSAENGEKAIKIYKEKKDEIHLILLDMIMPGLSGNETFDRIKEINPSVKVVLSTGYSLNVQAQRIMDKGCDGFLYKPFDIVQLSTKIHEVLKKHA